MTNAWAVVVAAGKGERLGLDYNKVFLNLAGRSVLSRCISSLIQSRFIDGIVLVLAEGDMERYEALKEADAVFANVNAVACGGATRQQSVLNGLERVPENVDIVAVHDAARPFTPPELIRAVIESAQKRGSGVAATRVIDTIKLVDADGRAVQTPERARLRAVQTPQAFKRETLLRAYRMAQRDGFSATDDAQIIETYIGPVYLVESGDARNAKLTTMEDLQMMNLRLTGEPRVGYGYDAHRFAKARALVLCGVEVPFELGLDGHSDADVAVHALMDALLGAAGLGDIGRHFPDSDPAYKGISSILLLKRVQSALFENGFGIVNADVTIVAQRPKLLPYIDKMHNALARALDLAQGAVNVKATTTEQMGFTGRMEGISASAVALIRREGEM